MAKAVCDFDCFNCTYADCIRDDGELTEAEIKSARVRDLMASLETKNINKSDSAAIQLAHQRERYRTDPEYRKRCLERSKAYYWAHKDQLLAYLRAYHNAHKDKRREQAAYRAEHKDEIAAKQAAYRAEHKDEIRRYNREYMKKRRAAASAGTETTAKG